jgi:prepilin-type N-terminal cleavage/methylation domain-containing protein
MQRRRARHPAAFTLLELVLVMLIMCIVTAMAAPSLSNFGRGRKASNCATQIVALTDWAHTQSITRGLTYRFNLDPKANAYWLTSEQPQGGFDTLPEEFGRVFQAPDGVKVDWDAPTQVDGRYVAFRPTGRVDLGATPVVTTNQQLAPGVTIRVTDPDGQVTVIVCPSPTEVFQILPAGQNR